MFASAWNRSGRTSSTSAWIFFERPSIREQRNAHQRRRSWRLLVVPSRKRFVLWTEAVSIALEGSVDLGPGVDVVHHPSEDRFVPTAKIVDAVDHLGEASERAIVELQ